MVVLEGGTDARHMEAAVGEGRATLRLKKDGQAVLEHVVRTLTDIYMLCSFIMERHAHLESVGSSSV